MVICSLDSVKKSSKKKETGAEKKIVELLNKLMTAEKGQESKRSEWRNSWLWTCTYLLAKLTLTLSSAFTFIDYF